MQSQSSASRTRGCHVHGNCRSLRACLLLPSRHVLSLSLRNDATCAVSTTGNGSKKLSTSQSSCWSRSTPALGGHPGDSSKAGKSERGTTPGRIPGVWLLALDFKLDALRLQGVVGWGVWAFCVIGVNGMHACTTKFAKASSWEALLFKVSAKKLAVGVCWSNVARKLGSFKCASMSCWGCTPALLGFLRARLGVGATGEPSWLDRAFIARLCGAAPRRNS